MARKKLTEKQILWRKTGLRAGDKAGLIELIQRDVSMENLNDTFEYIDPEGEMFEEEFIDAVGEKLKRWSTIKLLKYWNKYHYK